MKVFERTFAIEGLEEIVRAVTGKLANSNGEGYDPSKQRFTFDQEELHNHYKALDEFKTRHRSINERIHETKYLGNKLQDYFEKQRILDFHLRGDQVSFEAEYPELVEKARKFLGGQIYEETGFYSSLGSTSEGHSFYAELRSH